MHVKTDHPPFLERKEICDTTKLTDFKPQMKKMKALLDSDILPFLKIAHYHQVFYIFETFTLF